MVARRDVMATVMVTTIWGLAGCAGSRSGEPETSATEPSPTTATQRPTTAPSTPVEFRAADEPFRQLTTDKEGTGYGQRGIATLPAHSYGVLPLAPPGRFHIDGVVESLETPFDFVVLPVEEFERYQRGAAFSHVKDASLLGTTNGTFETTLPEEEYRIVFDNTRMGEAAPSPEVVIDFEWRITPPDE